MGIIDTISWGTVPDWVVAGAAALAALQGWKSLSTWRQEAGGRRRLELAEEILASVYEVGEAVTEVRNPIGHISENNDRPGREEEDERLRSYRDMYYPTIKRLKDQRPVFAALRAQRFRAHALFGEKLRTALDDVLKSHNEILAAASELYWDVPWDGELSEERLQRHHSLRELLWHSDGDEFALTLTDAMNAVEAVLRPMISKFAGKLIR